MNAKFTEQFCVDCRFAMDDTIWPHLSANSINCAEGYGIRRKLSKACRQFEAGKYKPESARNATI